ncbi:MAG: Ldh family oxidoreductase, partial [Gammaproteobacteria bacterium]|nr:Ldh family oxidoreductase [Gammaproteobacteria bacterium]
MRIEPGSLKSFASAVLGRLGAPHPIAVQVADSLICADEAGYNTHGLNLLPIYAAMINDGAINPAGEAIAEQITPSICRYDGRAAFGQVTGTAATRAGIDMALEHGLAVVAVRDGSHLGRLGEYAEMATSSRLIFMAFTNTGGGAKNVAPHGGHERKLSTNPIAFGIPTFDALPFDLILDFATSQISGSVIREYDRTSRPLHSEWSTTATGEPVESAKSFMDGIGALLPLGGRVTGHKGFGLALVAELLGGLAGGSMVGGHDPEWFSNAALFFMLDPDRFLNLSDFEVQVAALADHLRS